MFRFRSRWAVAVAAATGLAIVFAAGYAAAAANQFQGKSNKEYVRSGGGASTNTLSWTLLSDLTISGTWGKGDLLIARFTATSRCQGATGVSGNCMVRIALDCLDAVAPSSEFLPPSATLDPFDSASGSPSDVFDAESHATTRYLPLAAGQSGCVVIVEISVSSTDITFIVNSPVLTVDVVSSTAT
jgi:hypothetical protein